MKKIFLIILTFSVVSVSAQSYYEVLQNFVSRSGQLKSLNATFTADSLSLRRGLNPLDPSVELEYFLDNNFELSIRQQFDFPTLYHQRNMISKRGIDKARLQYRAGLRDLLLQVSDLYQDYVYYTNLVTLLGQRNTSMTKLDSVSRIALNKGNITAIEYKKTAMLQKAAANEFNNAQNDLSNIVERLQQIGVELGSGAKFEQFNFNGSKEEFVNNVMEDEFGVEMMKIDSLIGVHELKLSRQEWIPKIELGYKAEFDAGRLRNGIIAGVSIPLWQNRNNVKYSKAAAKAQSAQMQTAAEIIRIELNDLFEDYTTAKENCSMWDSGEFSDYDSLMEKSLAAHAITSMEYLLELTDWQNVQLQILKDCYNAALYGGRIAVYFSIN